MSAPQAQRPFRIAMLAPCPFPSFQGTQVVIHDLAAALSRAGHRVHLLTYGESEYEAESFAFDLHRAPPMGVGPRSGPSWRRPLADSALLHRAHTFLAKHDVDLIHAHNVEGLAIGLWLRRKHDLPLVYHAHNAMESELPSYYDSAPVRLGARLAGRLFDRTVVRRANAIVCFDTEQRDLHITNGAQAGRVFVIPPGIDASRLQEPDPERVRALRARLGPGPIVLYAGNPDRYQNLELLWRAWPEVIRTRPDARLLIASHHPHEDFPRLPSVPRPGTTLFEPYRSHAELKALYAIADVGVAPRTITTGVPVKVINYLAVGLPVVACRHVGAKLMTESEPTLTNDNAEAFAAGVLSALAHERRRDPRAESFHKFAASRQVPAYERIYTAVQGKYGA